MREGLGVSLGDGRVRVSLGEGRVGVSLGEGRVGVSLGVSLGWPAWCRVLVCCSWHTPHHVTPHPAGQHAPCPCPKHSVTRF